MSKQPIHVEAFEVKFSLDPGRVLTPAGGPTPEVASALRIGGAAEEYRVAFLDGPHLDFHTERWNIRFREKGGKREVSFKRRLPVYHGSVAGVLDTALRQGFDAEEQAEGYEAEVEWGPARQTLSLVKEADLGDAGWPATAAEAAALAAAALPGKLRKWLRDGWAAAVLDVSHLYGPVRARRWKWSALGGKTAFEVWDVRAPGGGTEPVVEVSLKARGEDEAAGSRAALRTLLEGRDGWLLADSVLKTDLVLDRYR